MAVQTKAAEKPWNELSPEQKLQKRLDAWLSPPGVKFASPEAEAAYKERVTIMSDALTLRKRPARVPIIPGLGSFAETYCGYIHKDIMTDVDKAIDVMNRCTVDFDLDTRSGANAYSAKVWELVDFKLYTWPGHGLADDADGVQYVEDEFMPPEEYGDFTRDPTAYWNRVYLPRILGSMEPLSKLPYVLCGMGATAGIPATMSAFGLQDVVAAFEKMAEAGREQIKWGQKMGAAGRKLTELGYPSTGGGASKAPFDLIGDSMRGTREIYRDMFKHPEKLLDAMDAIVPILIQMGVQTARMGDCPLVGFALHKGADGFMSDEHFKTFYWGPLRKICLGLIQEGLIPRMGAQGGYNSRLNVIGGMPRGKMLWAMGQGTDMARAKDMLGDEACFTGNLPAALIHAGTPAEIEDHIRKLMHVAGKGGGYMFSTAQGVNRTTKPENVWAMVKAAKKYGVYH